MSELDRLKKKSDALGVRLKKEIGRLTKASQLQLKTNALVEDLTKSSTRITIEKSHLDAMIAAGQKTEVSLPSVEAGATPERSPASEDSDHPAFLRKKS